MPLGRNSTKEYPMFPSATKCRMVGHSEIGNRKRRYRKHPLGSKPATDGVAFTSRSIGTLSHVTPLIRKHINPFGRYHFDLDRIRKPQADSSGNP